jgi:hypothetical protein
LTDSGTLSPAQRARGPSGETLTKGLSGQVLPVAQTPPPATLLRRTSSIHQPSPEEKSSLDSAKRTSTVRPAQRERSAV